MSFTDALGIFMGAVISFLTVIEVLPVRIDPWRYLLRGVGRAINGEVLHRVELLGDEVKSLNAAFKRHQAETCRARIIRFGDENLHNERHSKEHFDQVLLDIAVYEQYCSDTPGFANGVAALTIEHIKRIYADCLRTHSFL